MLLRDITTSGNSLSKTQTTAKAKATTFGAAARGRKKESTPKPMRKKLKSKKPALGEEITQVCKVCSN